MAEVVGLVAASGQFIEESIKIIKIAKAARDKYRDAPKEIENWQRQVESLQKLVESIPPNLHDAKEVTFTVDRCKAIGSSLLHTFESLQFSESDSFRHKTWRAAVSLLKEGEIRSLFSELEQLKSSLNLHIAIKNLNDNRGASHTTTLLEDALSSLILSDTESDEERCLRALFITDARSDRDGLITMKGHRTPGTFEWIPQTKQYQDWDASEKGLLWISGAPGKGKTVISIFLSELLEATKYTVIYFFCDNKTASRNSAVNVLRGLMSQVIQQHLELLNCLLSTWKIQKETLFRSFETLWRIFHQMLETLKGEEVCCVLDALDECDEHSLTLLLCKITDLYDSPSGLPLKLIIASREEPKALSQAFARYPRITLEHIDKDIQLYISQKVSYLAKIKMIHGSPLHCRIEKAFHERAEGTFLWVSYMAHDLETMSLREIELSLAQLPRGLYEIYERIVSQIKVETHNKIGHMLTWILFAKRPLDLSDLCEAVQIQESQALSGKEVCIDYIRSCGHLLQLQSFDKSSQTWVAYLHSDTATHALSELRTTFLHQSAKDFLLRTDKTRLFLSITTRSNQAHLRILDRLLVVLTCHLSVGEILNYENLKAIPLLWYAVFHLVDHIDSLGREIKLILPKHEAFFSKVSRVRDTWAYHYLHCSPSSEHLPLLHMACRQGLYWLAKSCLQRKDIPSLIGRHRKINERWGEYEETPLHLAVKSGSLDTVRLLLSCGADVTSETGYRRTPLHYAFQNHNDEIYRLLADSKGSSKVYQRKIKELIEKNGRLGRDSLLHLAATNGWEDLCQELIHNHNYNVEWEGRSGYRTIHLALQSGHVNLARRLVMEWGALLTPHFHLLESILAPRLARDSLKEALETYTAHWGCDINTTDADGCTVFHKREVFHHCTVPHTRKVYRPCSLCREYRSDFDIVQTISNAGLTIDFNQLNHRYQTFLHCGYSWTRDPRLLTMFLSNSHFDINTRDDQGCTPLHRAIRLAGEIKPDEDDILTIQVLLDLGADRSLRDEKDRSPADSVREEWGTKEEWVIKYYARKALLVLRKYATVPINVRNVQTVLNVDNWPRVHPKQNTAMAPSWSSS